MADRLVVLVSGATGHQGGAVARSLLKRGHTVRALTRHPASASAKKIAELGAELVQGDLADGAAVKRAAEGADTAYIMSTPYETGIEEDKREGLTATRAAAEAGVGHLIFSSVASVNQNTGIPHFDSKWPVEQQVAKLGVPWTISAPVWFMDNLLSVNYLPGIRAGTLTVPMPAERKLQQIAVADIGEFVAEIIEGRERYFGKRYDIAGDEVSSEEVAAILSEASGRDIKCQSVSPDVLRPANEDWAIMFEWFINAGYSADIAGLRKEFPAVGWHSFAQWAREQDWGALLKE